MTTAGTGEPDGFVAIADEFVERLRRGERPCVSEYVERYPAFADRIREFFPDLVELELAGATSDPAVETEAPSVIGEYRIIRRIGAGGMGVVFEAEQPSLGRRVALKILPLHRADHNTYLARFRTEARAAAALHHTNIVPVFSVGSDRGLQYFAMQFIDGHGLDAVLRDVRRLRSDAAAAAETAGVTALTQVRSTPYYRETARLALQVAEALAHAHAHGVLHRDVKPSNLLLDRTGQVWLSDFGLAKFAGDPDLTNTMDVIGTLAYMAPERLDGHADARSDIYSFGLTLREMAVLEPPFPGADRLQLLRRIASEEPVDPQSLATDLPRDLALIIRKATAKAPADRYACFEDVAEDLRRYLADRPVNVRRTPWWEQWRRWRRRNRTVANLAAGLFSVLLAVAVAGVWAAGRYRQISQTARQAEAERGERALDAMIAEARALRRSGTEGRRFRSLELLRQAASARPHDPTIRDEAIAALALYDVRPESDWWDAGAHGDVDYDPALNHCAVPQADRSVSILRTSDHTEVCRFQLPPGGWHIVLNYSPGGRFLLARMLVAGPEREWAVVLDTEHGGEPVLHRCRATWMPDGTLLLHGSEALYAIDPATGREVRRLSLAAASGEIVIPDPAGQRLAILNQDTGQTRLHDAISGDKLREFGPAPVITSDGAWSPDGRLFAIGGDDCHIHLFDTHTGRWIATLSGHQSRVIKLGFHPVYNVLASWAWDGTTRFWDPATGHELLNVPGIFARWSADGQRCGLQRKNEIRRADVADCRICRTFHAAPTGNRQPSPSPSRNQFASAQFHPDARRFVTAGFDGVHLWDTESGRGERLDAADASFARFSPDGSRVLQGRRSHPPVCVASLHAAGCGPFMQAPGFEVLRTAVDGQWPAEDRIVVAGEGRAAGDVAATLGLVIRDGDGPGRWLPGLGRGSWLTNIDVSPDCHTAALAFWRHPRVIMANLDTGAIAETITPCDLAAAELHITHVRFDPRGCLLTAGVLEHRWWNASAATPLGMTKRENYGTSCRPDFAPDGGFIVVQVSPSCLAIMTPDGSRVLARLTPPTPRLFNHLTVSPDGRWLLAADFHSLDLWDFAALRRELQSFDLTMQ